MKITPKRLEELRNEVDGAEAEYLRAHGWKHTSNNPACLWLWEKPTSEGRTILVSQDTAIHIQDYEDANDPDSPEGGAS